VLFADVIDVPEGAASSGTSPPRDQLPKNLGDFCGLCVDRRGVCHVF